MEVLRESGRSAYDEQVYRQLRDIAKRLNVDIGVNRLPPFIARPRRTLNNGQFWVTRAGRRKIDMDETYSTASGAVLTLAHELGHALGCVVNSVPWRNAETWIEERPLEYIQEEETAWALAEILVDELAYRRSPAWNRQKAKSLESYYRMYFKDRSVTLEEGRSKCGTDLAAIVERAKAIRAHKKVVKLLPLPS